MIRTTTTLLGVFFLFAQLPPGVPDPVANKAEQQRKQLHTMTLAFPAPELVGREPASDLEHWLQVPPLREHLQALENEYSKELAKDIQPYRNLKGTIQYTRERLNAFEEALRNYANITRFQEDAQHARKMMLLAKENQAPAYFRSESDIMIRMRTINLRLQVLEKLDQDPKNFAEAKKLAQTLANEIRVSQKALSRSIIESNELPSDLYQQADREELLQQVEKAWINAHPRVKPLKIGIIGSAWTRSKKWEVQNRTLYEIDRSRIQGFVVVPHDQSTVMLKHIQLQIDHTDGEKRTAWILDGNYDPEPSELLLKTKIK